MPSAVVSGPNRSAGPFSAGAPSRIVPVPVDYAAIDAPDAFLLGYGLDYAGRYRNLPGLWIADGQTLAADPDRYVAQLHHSG